MYPFGSSILLSDINYFNGPFLHNAPVHFLLQLSWKKAYYTLLVLDMAPLCYTE